MAHEHTLDGPSTPGETGHDAADDQAGSVPEGGDQADVVELSVPALGAYLGVVRTATAGLAARLSFSLDEIEDLRIAVDEACVMLLSLPAPPPPETATLTCRFRVLDEGLSVRVSAPVGRQAILPGEQSFAWQVLTAHAAAVRGHADGGHAEIDLLKRRRRR